MKKKEYRLKLKRGRWIRFFSAFVRLFKKKPKLINLSGEELADKAIYLSNHAGAGGPLVHELYFPKRLTCWGAHEMCEGVKSRWRYLYFTFYRKKLHWGRFRAFTVATLFAPISLCFYRGVGLIPTYTDSRSISTVKTSCRILDANSALMIFPEDSSDGYHNPPKAFNQGFVVMSKLYRRVRKEDVPVYLCYYGAKEKVIVVSKPIFVNRMLENGMTEEEVRNEALKITQDMYRDCVAPLQKKK